MLQPDLEQRLAGRVAEGREISRAVFDSSGSRTFGWVNAAIGKGLITDTPETKARFAEDLGAVAACFHPDNMGVFPGELSPDVVGAVTGMGRERVNMTISHLLELGGLFTRTAWEQQNRVRALGRPLRGISGL